LSEDIKIAIILRDIQEMTYEEISEYLEIPIGTVKSRINRGRIQLAKYLMEMKKK
jgi:RNA polymerase sigma-70 factor (ECF subfamily)